MKVKLELSVTNLSSCMTLTFQLLVSLPAFVIGLRKDPTPVKLEYEALPKPEEGKSDFGEKEELRTKNRFRNFITYDANRVTLSVLNFSPLSAYTNASYIQGYHKNEKLIASQGESESKMYTRYTSPNKSTLDDFWRMIWEYNVGVVVMVTRCIEDSKVKCEQYWPDDGSVEHGEITVELVTSEDRPDHVIRKLKIHKGDEPPRQLTQIQFVDWSDHGVPEHVFSLLAIRHAVKRLARDDQYIVIHCSAGVGRTGTFLAIDYPLSQADKEGFVDIYKCVKALREQQMSSVQTQDQYTFIYKAVLEGLTIGDTTVAKKDLHIYLSKLLTDESSH